jgi:hypothetical protein
VPHSGAHGTSSRSPEVYLAAGLRRLECQWLIDPQLYGIVNPMMSPILPGHSPFQADATRFKEERATERLGRQLPVWREFE